MLITMLNREVACENTMPEVEQAFQQLSQWLTEMGQQVVCLEIDGLEVFDDYEQYFMDHMDDIQRIVVQVKSVKEVLKDILISVRDYLVRAIPEIDQLVDQFYHDVTPATWNSFSQLIEGLQFIVNSLDAVNQHAEWYFQARQFILAKDNLSKKISMLQEAMESQDRVWLSDVLLYEIVPIFNSLSMVIEASQSSANVQ